MHTYVFIGFTTKVTVKIDKDMELGAKNCLDDSVAEPKMYANPEVAELNDENPITQTVTNSHILFVLSYIASYVSPRRVSFYYTCSCRRVLTTRIFLLV